MARDACLSAYDNNTQGLQILALSCSRVIAIKGFILAFLPKNVRRDSTKAYIYMFLLETQKPPVSKKALHCY